MVNVVLEQHPELFLVDIVVKGNIGTQKVLILIDGDKGINIDDCSMVSRAVGHQMEEEDLLDGRYNLEVSSPGLDHPITLKRQYAKNVGRNLDILTLENERIKGKLLEVSDDNITLEVDKKTQEIAFNEINKTKIEVSFK